MYNSIVIMIKFHVIRITIYKTINLQCSEELKTPGVAGCGSGELILQLIQESTDDSLSLTDSLLSIWSVCLFDR